MIPKSFSRRSGHWLWRNQYASFTVPPRHVAFTLLFAAFTILAALFAITLGKVQVPFETVLAVLAGARDEGGIQQQVIINLRLPRVLAAIFTGAALGVSGSVFQSISRNTLGSPDIIGFTTGAAAGALIQIVVLGGGPFAIAISAVAGGMLTAMIVYFLSVKHGVTGGYRLVLVGIGVGATLSAFNGLMLVKGDLDSAISANLWLAGSLNARGWEHVFPVMVGCIVLIPLVSLSANRLSMIEMGDDVARQLGIQVERTRLSMIFCAVLLAGLATAATGPIAFIALAAPQLAARLAGPGGIPVIRAAVMGACLLVLADILTQIAAFRLVLPIGRVTGLVGGLYLIWLLTRSRRL